MKQVMIFPDLTMEIREVSDAIINVNESQFKDATHQDIENIKEYYKSMIQEKANSFCVIYETDCDNKKCKCHKEMICEKFVVLDRYPMSEGIHGKCPECGHWVIDRISDPIRFHCTTQNNDFSLEDLTDMVIVMDIQKYFNHYEAARLQYVNLSRKLAGMEQISYKELQKVFEENM